MEPTHIHTYTNNDKHATCSVVQVTIKTITQLSRHENSQTATIVFDNQPFTLISEFSTSDKSRILSLLTYN